MKKRALLKSVARQLLPPIIVDGLKAIRQTVRYGAPEWKYLPQGWPTDDPDSKGWSDPSIPDTQKAKWGEFLQLTAGTGPLGIAHEANSLVNDDLYAHHLVMAFGYVLALAAVKKDRLSLLDWGGGLGHYAVLSESLLPGTPVDYWCWDHAAICSAGREVLPKATFVDQEAQLGDRSFDLVLASGALQCVRDWKETARILSLRSNPYLFVTRQPFVREHPSFVTSQSMRWYGYKATVAYWFLNRTEFLDHMASLGLSLVREFVFEKHPRIRSAPERADIQGFLFRRKGSP